MKLFAAMVAVAALAFASSEADAQCFRNNIVAVNSGFVQQQVLVPQSTAFFTGGRQVAFINQPVFVGAPAVQQIDIRRGLFGRVRRVRVQNFAAPVNVVSPVSTIQVGRRSVFISGFGY